MILLIDNYDSFTFNLYQQIESLGAKTNVFQHDKISISQIKKLKPQKIVISPGPKNPKESGISMQVIKEFHPKIPILGVCLGHQCIGATFGSKIIQAKTILHGKTSPIFHDESSIYKTLPSPLVVARYHSLVIDTLPENFKLTAWTENKEIMAIQHQEYPLYGIQFHPESFLTPHGNKIMKNFLNET